MTNPATEVAGVVDIPWRTMGKAILGGGLLLAGYEASKALFALAKKGFNAASQKVAPNQGTQSVSPAADTSTGWS